MCCSRALSPFGCRLCRFLLCFFSFFYLRIVSSNFFTPVSDSIVSSLSPLHSLFFLSAFIFWSSLIWAGEALAQEESLSVLMKESPEMRWQSNTNWSPGERRVCAARLLTTAVSLCELGLRRKETQQKMPLVMSIFTADRDCLKNSPHFPPVWKSPYSFSF